MKKIKFTYLSVLALLLVNALFVSCSSDETKIEEQKESPNLIIQGSYHKLANYRNDSSSYYWKLNDFDTKINLKGRESSLSFLRSNVGTKNNTNEIIISSEELPFQLKLSSNDNNSDGSVNITYEIIGEDIVDNLSIYNSEFSSSLEIINNLIDSVNTSNNKESFKKACPPCIVVVVGIVVYAINDHCNTVVEEGVAGCSRNGKCADVSACSVTCKSCDNNQ